MVRLKSETGSLAPKPQGNPGRGKLTGVKGWVVERQPPCPVPTTKLAGSDRCDRIG
jgi:hypothetical protein